MAQEFVKLYPAASDQEAGLTSNAAVRDNTRVSITLWATLWKKAATQPVYTYYWTHASPGPEHDRRGAAHGTEIPYVFNNLYASNRPWTNDDRKIADTMSSYWANFAATGNPNGKNLPEWLAFDPKAPAAMEVGDHFAPMAAADPVRFDFIQRYFLTQEAW